MGEEESEPKIPEVEANGTSASHKSDPVLTDRKGENNEVEDMDDDTKENKETGAEKMDEDPKVNNEKASTEEKDNMGKDEEKEQPKTEGLQEKTAPGHSVLEEKEDIKEVEEVDGSEEKAPKEEDEVDGSEEKAQMAEEVDGSEEKEEKIEEVGGSDEEGEKAEETEEKVLRKRGKGKSGGEKKNDKEKVEKKGEAKQKNEPDVRTPASDRPQRERKTVERLVISIEKDAGKEFQIQKGRGTPLKDIPNVAFKLSRKKTDDTFKLLHSILFGRRGKAVEIKSNISRFSGFVWHENEEKQRNKVKEKFDKYNKEKLLEFCDVLDIPVSKAATKKEDVVVKLIDFLLAPHATSKVLLAEKEKESKSKKRKRVTKSSTSRGSSSAHSAKSRKKAGDASKAVEREVDSEDESEEEKEEEENEEENENGVAEKSDTEMPEHSESTQNESEEVEESEEDVGKRKRSKRKPSEKKKSAGKAETRKTTTPRKSRTPKKAVAKKSSPKHSEGDDDCDAGKKVFSRKKKTGKEKSSTPTKSPSKEKSGKKAAKGKENAEVKEETLKPTDDELRDAICEIFKEVDFNTATFTDILKQLAGRFDTDLTQRKSSIKVMIQEELTKLADEGDDEDGEEKDENQPAAAGKEVEA